MAIVQHKAADKTVASIPARNAISPRPDHMTVVVLDATGDVNVLGGKAIYKWNATTDSWLLLTKDNADALDFANESKTIVADQVTTSNVPMNGVIWDVYVLDDATKVITHVEWGISGAVITIAPDTAGQFDGKKLCYSYAYGSTAVQIAASTQAALAGKQDSLVSGTNIKTVNGSSLLGSGNVALITSQQLNDALAAKEPTLSAPLTYTYTGTLAAPPVGYQTAPMPVSPTGKERIGGMVLALQSGLTGIEFPKLEVVGGGFTLNAMAALTSLSLPALATVGGAFTLSTMAALTSLSLPALATVGGNFNPYSMAALTSLSLPALAAVGGGFTLNAMAALTSLSLPALTTVWGITLTGQTGALATLTIGSTLKNVSDNVNITSAALSQVSVDGLLARLAALDGTNGTTVYGTGRTVTIKGTSATPSAAGLASKAILVARGVTVAHN